MKIKIDENTEFLVKSSEKDSSVLFSSKIRGSDGSIFLASVSLSSSQVEHLILALSSEKAKAKKNV